MNITTPRENIISLYRRQGYTFAPVEFSMCHALCQQYKDRAGDTPMGEYFDYPEGFAMGRIAAPATRDRGEIDWAQYFDEPLKPGTHFDGDGVAHEPGSQAAQHMTYMRHPMEKFTSLEQFQAYPLAEVSLDNLDEMTAQAKALQAAGKAVIGHMAATVWETSWYLRSMPALMMDMIEEDEKATWLLDNVTARACQRAEAYARAGVDILAIGDDVGMQESIMMSQPMYQQWIKPRLTRVIDAARAINPDVLVHYHTCGYVEPLIDDLIEAGIDILNPVQPECMDFSEIHAKYGDRLSFNGTVGTQTTMPFGTPAEVRETVFRNLEIAGETGGLLCCPTHLLEPEVPFENIEAYVAACKEFTK